MAQYDIAHQRVLKQEGGYQNSVKDRGNYVSVKGNWAAGKYPFSSPDNTKLVLIGTNKGITAPELFSHLGRMPTVSEMKNLSDETVAYIYKKNYWKPIQGDLINNQSVADILFDGAVNQGVGYMSRALQRILKVEVDGQIGPVTIAALNKANQNTLFSAIKNNRKTRYKETAKQPGQKTFLEGWMVRINSFTDNVYHGLADNVNNNNTPFVGVAIAVSLFFLVKPFLK